MTIESELGRIADALHRLADAYTIVAQAAAANISALPSSEPPKRGRPRKTAEAPADTASAWTDDAAEPAQAPAAEPEPQPQPEPVAAQPAATLESVRARFVTLTQRGKRDALLALLAAQGVETLSKADAAQLATIADALTALESQA